MLDRGSHLEIVNTRFWEPLTRRYRLRGSHVSGHRPVVFADQVVAVSDADRVLDVYDYIEAIHNPAANGVSVALITTPVGKLRWLQWASQQITAAANYNYQVVLRHPSETTLVVPLDVIRIATIDTEFVVPLGQPVPMGPGWNLAVRVTSWIGGGNFTLKTVIREQDIVDNRSLPRLLA